MRQQNQVLGVPQDVLSVFDEADQVCGFTNVLEQASYPPGNKIFLPGNPQGENFRLRSRQDNASSSDDGCTKKPDTPAAIKESIDDCNGGCATATTAQNYLAGLKPW